MVVTSLRSGTARVIKSRKPSCFRSQGRISRSMRLVNSGSECGFMRAVTLRANMSPPVAGFLACDELCGLSSSAFQHSNVTFEAAQFGLLELAMRENALPGQQCLRRLA